MTKFKRWLVLYLKLCGVSAALYAVLWLVVTLPVTLIPLGLAYVAWAYMDVEEW